MTRHRFPHPPRRIDWRATAVAHAAALALATGVLLPACATGAETAAASAPAWAHEQAQRAPDPAVRFGRLPNGLRYAIQHNETPKDGVAMRLRIGSGSLQEHDDEQGLAHFLEHMAFRGSAQVPDGEVVHMLQRQGLAFGADTNAFTAQDQTVYHFDFPKADAAALDTGLMLFAEIGQHLALDPRLIDEEKGVVLSEERARDVPPLRAAEAETDLALAATLVPRRWPIGQVATIQAADAPRLRRFYAANYRPDNATIVVVGNVDVDAVERRIRERFSAWKPTAPATTADLGTPRPTHAVAEFVADGAPDVLSLTWLLPPDNRIQTREVAREQLLQQLGVIVLNLRLADRTLQPGSPFLGAGASVQTSVFKVAGEARLGVTAPADQWRTALDAVVENLRQLMAQGVQPADLQRVVPLMRTAMQGVLAQAPTRAHAAIADGLVNSVNANEPYQSAAQDLADTEVVLSTVTPEQLTAELRRTFGGTTPLVFRSTQAGGVGAEALGRQLAHAMASPLAAQAVATAVDWPYTDFGAPGAIVARSTDAELGTTTVQFANGTRLIVKPTAQQKDKVNVQVLFGQGRAGMKPEQARALWALPYLTLGGTGKRSFAELLQWQQASGKQVKVTLQAAMQTFALVGDTRPADLLAQLQVLAAYQRDPGFRPELGEKLAGIAPMLTNMFDANTNVVYAREVARVMDGGDERLGPLPTDADLATARAEDLPALLRTPLAGAADVVIVGDVPLDAAIAATQATIGAGPARPRPPRLPIAVVPPADGGAPHVVTHGGRADQALLGEHWTMPDLWADVALTRTGRVAAEVLQARLVDSVREKLGITYSPSASGGGSLEVVGQGSFSAQIETPPDKFDVFRQLLQDQLRDLAAKPVSADELQRARRPLVERSIKAPEDNGHWVFWLPRVLADDRMKGAMLSETSGYQAVTAQQVQAYFRDHIAGRPPIEVVARVKTADAK